MEDLELNKINRSVECLLLYENRLFTLEEIHDEVLESNGNRKNFQFNNVVQIEIERNLLEFDESLDYIERTILKKFGDLNDVDQIERKQFYIHKKYLYLFWENLLENKLNSRKKEFSIDEFWPQMEISFLNYYGLNATSLFVMEANIDYNKHSNFNSIHFYGDDADQRFFYTFLEEKKDKYYINEYSKTEWYKNFYVGLRSWFKDGLTSPSRVILKKEIMKILRGYKAPIRFDNLLFQLNIADFKCGLPKPYSKELITEIINENKERFLFSPNGEITLIDETECLPKYFFENRELLKNFNFNKSTSGILAFSYLSNKFPLNEAEEYVNVRPIIHLALVKNLKEEFPKLITDLTENELFTPEREFIFLLKSILPEDASIEEWLNENIAVSFYEEDAQDLKLVMPKIIGHLSPVFNLAQNPGHLFPYTLKEKLENFTKKKIGEIDDGK